MSDGKQMDYEEESTEQQQNQPAQRQVPQDEGSDFPIKEGAVTGAIAVIATYLTHLFLTAIVTAQVRPEAESVGVGDDATLVITEMVSSWKAAGWSYLSVFGTGFEAEGETAFLSDAPNHGAAFAGSLGNAFTLSTLFLFIVTVGGIVTAGYAVAKYTDADDAVDAAKAGVTVAVPYLAFAAIAAVVMTHTFSEVPTVVDLIGSEAVGVYGLESTEYLNDAGDQVVSDVEFGPSTTDAILFAGIIVPAILGAVGGVLTQRRDAFETVMAKVQ
ncbi:hypothetical protein [Natrinema sp. SYSU A 869]|uniref:hypothetical protein n=1 Tax=Natrinema sp. SYSU A 869 TaxID=2871694 RepID=UPI001CA3DBBA|nr:hypothetical protein [Natrinema sp. SYSU A 869]